MDWRTHYFGDGNPSRGRRIAVHPIMAVLALALYGMWNDFISDDGVPWPACAYRPSCLPCRQGGGPFLDVGWRWL
jgi:hypothetical protein